MLHITERDPMKACLLAIDKDLWCNERHPPLSSRVKIKALDLGTDQEFPRQIGMGNHFVRAGEAGEICQFPKVRT